MDVSAPRRVRVYAVLGQYEIYCLNLEPEKGESAIDARLCRALDVERCISVCRRWDE